MNWIGDIDNGEPSRAGADRAEERKYMKYLYRLASRDDHKNGRLVWTLQLLLIASILGVIYWGNGNDLNTVDPPIVQVIEEHKDEIQALQRAIAEKDRTIASLKVQLKTAKYAMKQYETRLAEVRQTMPTVASVQQAVLQATRTDEGLKQETKRVLGDLGITKIQVIR